MMLKHFGLNRFTFLSGRTPVAKEVSKLVNQ